MTYLLKLITSLIWFLIIPEIAGLGILSFKKENKNMIFALIIGYILEFAVFQFIAVPCIFLHTSLVLLIVLWVFVMITFSVLSIIRVRKSFKDIILDNIKKLKEMPKFLSAIAIVIILFQAFVAFKYMHEDYDDSNFVAKATISYDTNTLYEYDDIGKELDSIPSRNGISPYPIFTAMMAKLTTTHPAIMAHTIFPPLFIIIAYMLYYLIGKALFKDDKQKAVVFLIIISILYMFGDYTRYSVFVRLLYRIWQGKSVLCAIILPFIWYLFIEYLGKENDKFYWVILFLTLLGADLLSAMSLYLPIIVSGILTVIYAIKYKKPKYILYYILCIIPSMIYGVIYLFLN